MSIPLMDTKNSVSLSGMQDDGTAVGGTNVPGVDDLQARGAGRPARGDFRRHRGSQGRFPVAEVGRQEIKQIVRGGPQSAASGERWNVPVWHRFQRAIVARRQPRLHIGGKCDGGAGHIQGFGNP
jgi:hypothetical protein